jgi:hypothetical protein
MMKVVCLAASTQLRVSGVSLGSFPTFGIPFAKSSGQWEARGGA